MSLPAGVVITSLFSLLLASLSSCTLCGSRCYCLHHCSRECLRYRHCHHLCFYPCLSDVQGASNSYWRKTPPESRSRQKGRCKNGACLRRCNASDCGSDYRSYFNSNSTLGHNTRTGSAQKPGGVSERAVGMSYILSVRGRCDGRNDSASENAMKSGILHSNVLELAKIGASRNLCSLTTSLRIQKLERHRTNLKRPTEISSGPIISTKAHVHPPFF